MIKFVTIFFLFFSLHQVLVSDLLGLCLLANSGSGEVRQTRGAQRKEEDQLSTIRGEAQAKGDALIP